MTTMHHHSTRTAAAATTLALAALAALPLPVGAQTPAVIRTLMSPPLVLQPGASCYRRVSTTPSWAQSIVAGYCRVQHNGGETAIVGALMSGDDNEPPQWHTGTVPLQLISGRPAP